MGISHGIEETDQFNHVAFMDDITVVAQDDPGSQVLMDAVQEFEFWSNTKLNMTKTVKHWASVMVSKKQISSIM